MYNNSLFNFKNSIGYLSIAGHKIIVGEDILTFRNVTRSDTINSNDLRCILDIVDYCQNIVILK